MLLEISEIESLVTRWICLGYQTESALGSFVLYDYSLYLVVSSLEGLSCKGKALQWESMFKHQLCFIVWMNFKPTFLCIWTPSLQNGMEKKSSIEERILWGLIWWVCKAIWITKRKSCRRIISQDVPSTQNCGIID